MTPEAHTGLLAVQRTLWKGRLDEARAAYEKAVALLEAVLREGDSAQASPDVALRRRLALFRETEAREEYVRVLKIYADLVVHNIAP